MAVNPDDITSLAGDIGPRIPGTGKERRAAHYVMERLRDLGIAAALLPLKTPPSFVPIFVPLLAITALAVPAAVLSRFLGLLIAVFGSGLIVLELIDRPLVSDMFANRRSNNVLGILPATINDEIGEPARRVILTAHIDTGRGGLIWHRTLIRSFRAIVLIVLASAAAVPILMLIYTIHSSKGVWIASLVPMVILLVAALLLFESEWRGTPLVGANDNASGVAALLALARNFSATRLDHVEIWFLFTTGVEAGLIGMNRFLDENSFDPRETYFINVDHVGSGRVHFTRAEGLLRSVRSSPHLIRVLSDVAARHPDWDVTTEVHRLLPTDQYAALIRGYDAVTIMALDKESYLPHWHQRTDTPDTVDQATVQIAVDLTAELMCRLDAEAGEEAARAETAPSADTPDLLQHSPS